MNSISKSGKHTQERQYAVFISYRHADNQESGRQWATWLHHTLETYEIPPDLVGCINMRGELVPASLYPVFRDEEELPADADLSSNIQRALQNSTLLVVICSPRAVASRFVVEEIQLFKELGKSDHILALMIDGEPNASDDPAKASAGIDPGEECLPASLRFGAPGEGGTIDWSRRTEPIAADVRPQGKPCQGWTTTAAYRDELARRQLGPREIDSLSLLYEAQLQLAVSKIVAGALGVPLGELTRRDRKHQIERARRRARVLRSWLATVSVLALLAVLGGVAAMFQRNKAETARADESAQRAIAVKALGESEEQRKLARDALADSERQRSLAEEQKKKAIASRSDAEEVVFFLLSEMQLKLTGFVPKEMLREVLQRAEQHYTKLGFNEGDTAQMQNIGILYHHQAVIYESQGDTTAAENAHRKKRDIFKQLQARDPGNTRWLDEIAMGNVLYARLLWLKGDTAAAQNLYDEALDLIQKVVASEPVSTEWQNDLGNVLNLVGEFRQSQGRLPEAKALLERSLAVRKELVVKSPENVSWRSNLACSHYYIGLLLEAEKDHEQAMVEIQAAINMVGEILKKRPKDVAHQNSLASMCERLAVLAASKGDFFGQESAFQRVLDMRLSLAQQEPPDFEQKARLAGSYAAVASAQLLNRLFVLAEENLSRAVDIWQDLARQEKLSAADAEIYRIMFPRLAQIRSNESFKLLEPFAKLFRSLPPGNSDELENYKSNTLLPFVNHRWENNEGKEIEAAFVGLAGESVTLRAASGTIYKYPLGNLSAETQSHVILVHNLTEMMRRLTMKSSIPSNQTAPPKR